MQTKKISLEELRRIDVPIKYRMYFHVNGGVLGAIADNSRQHAEPGNIVFPDGVDTTHGDFVVRDILYFTTTDEHFAYCVLKINKAFYIYEPGYKSIHKTIGKRYEV